MSEKNKINKKVLTSTTTLLTMTPFMKSFGVRLDAETASEIEKAARFTGLKPSDLLRLGSRMVLADIKANDGLRLGNREDSKPARRRKSRAA